MQPFFPFPYYRSVTTSVSVRIEIQGHPDASLPHKKTEPGAPSLFTAAACWVIRFSLVLSARRRGCNAALQADRSIGWLNDYKA
mmetsp:Transcript_30428/g.59779  ORF Transcript_30428/g.59779 Transcript_30428/m.59779 type:complete len:84 (+) Transcript_30428:176-427(+)